MSNHYHLLIQVGEDPLSHLMRRLLSGYATNYNIRNKRSGYVFQNRYKSILCDEDNYFLELIRYIHLNPIKVRMLKDISALDVYPWTGHSALMHEKPNDWQKTDEVLSRFRTQKAAARRHYRAFIVEGMTEKSSDMSGGGLIRSYGGWQEISKLRKNHETRIGDERILGDSDFVQRVIKNDEIKLEETLLLKQKGWDLEKLVQSICHHFNITQDQISMKGRSNSVSYAKAVICYWGNARLGISSTQLGAKLSISQSSVSRAVRRGREYCKDYDFDLLSECPH